MRLLLVEGSVRVQDLLVRPLGPASVCQLTSTEFAGFRAALRQLAHILLFVDRALPDDDRLELISELPSATCPTPILGGHNRSP